MAGVLGKLTAVTWPWATMAAILVAGFMYWLYVESSAIQPAVVVADTTETVPQVADTVFVRNPTQFSRQRVLLSPVTVAEQIGRAALTADLPGLAGYPLILERSVLESGLTVVGGDNLSVAGQVYALNDSIIEVYLQRGFFDPENRAKLEGHTTFFLVDSLDFVFPEAAETPGGAGS
ncbi:MAG: hypothetical protein PVJ43_13405 [Gemmatimonadales bacterium]